MALIAVRPVARGLGLVLVALALAGIAYPLWWNHRSATGGNALLAQANSQLRVSARNAASCPSAPKSATRPIGSTPGILEIPSIHLVAPVLNGLSDAVLNVAVGHDPQTAWPGAAGESIVEAHDVSYFSNLSAVRRGASVIWLTACAKSQFTVLSTGVKKPGDLLQPPSGGSGLALITCYPTNALFWTPDRFVVTTKLVAQSIKPQALPSPGPSAPRLSVPAPSALVAQGLQLDQNTLLMGVLRITGRPSSAFSSGPAPLSVEAQALEVFFGAKKAVVEHNATWWKDLTVHGLAFRSSWPAFGQANVTINVVGMTPTEITISSGASSATIVNNKGVLLLSSVT